MIPPTDLPVVKSRLAPTPLAKRLQAKKALFHSAFVQPFPGYGAALEKRVGQMDELGGITRKRTGANKRFLSERGMTSRNLVWGHAVEVAVSEALLRWLIERPQVPRRVEVYLDRKELSREDETLLAAQFERFGSRLSDVLAGYRGEVPGPAAERLDEFLTNMPKEVSELRPVFAAKEECPHGPAGLWLADSLASTIKRDLVRCPSSGGIIDRLTQIAPAMWMRDMSQAVCRPVGEAVIARWRERMER